ncbi:glycosyltransferase family 1 protein [Tsuneonella sp. CC-YZS046]|uniref:glycosyltransferase family 4 protein n=1 Tax=Tsuneonella sp. CC-YZS046 TaxID=3042152 RepID=UPI002D76E7E8|nr:glycosyltransferase family 1 protein [Tsuneonella sp. CC-YZS046]WRO65644.1 glycosyltransferase family 1 protein [Tsuneonella sp. CC-YZS046]
MRNPRRVVVNGKFLTAESTGVHRVASELVRNSIAIIEEDPQLSRQLALEVWVPTAGIARARTLGVPFRVVQPLQGIPWEQITLPARARGRLILSLCNVGPLAARNAVTMFHDAQVHITPQSYGFGFRSWYRLHQPLAGRRHRRILTVSDFSREQLEQYGLSARERIGVILNGVDHVLAITPDDAILDRLGLRPQGYVVGLANTQQHKNIGLLLRAFADPSLRDLKLVLFGSHTAADFAALGHDVPENVLFAGRVSDAELRALYASALCIGFPSTTEGFGLPPLEAMTTGCPAVVAPCGALPQACGSAAIYAAPDAPDQWVAAIRKLADDADLRRDLSEKSREWAAGFTWRNAANRLIEELLAL